MDAQRSRSWIRSVDAVFCACAGGKFALSPINPTGMLVECKRLGLLGVPSALSSNEMWEMHRQGAQMIKMFHAGQVTAKILKYVAIVRRMMRVAFFSFFKRKFRYCEVCGCELLYLSSSVM